MDTQARIDLLARVARAGAPTSEAPLDPSRPVSILSLAAASYSARPSEDATVPTGFDPVAVALFEAIVEGAYVVANSDGDFDDEERRTFERVVIAACGGTVPTQSIASLVNDLADQLKEDGIDRRVRVLAKTLTKREHAQEALRIAALLAQTSDDVSDAERRTLEKIATQCGLQVSDVDRALAEVKTTLARVDR